MGTCCSSSTNEHSVNTTPLISNSEPNSDAMWEQQRREEEVQPFGQYDAEPYVAGAVNTGKKRTTPPEIIDGSLGQQEGPPEKAPTMCEDDVDEYDGAPLHLPVDAATTSDSTAQSFFAGLVALNTRTVTVVGVSKNPQKCPYCNTEGGNVFFYLTMMRCSLSLLDKLYQAGWWRTGTICFKPDIRSVCCPNYSIRLEVSRYIVSKSHRANIRRFKNFLQHGDSRWKTDTSSNNANQNIETKIVANKIKQKRPVQTGKGPDPNKPPCRKAKEIKRERWKEKHGEASVKQQPKAKTLEEYLLGTDNSASNQRHTFRQELHSCNPPSDKLQAMLPREYELYCMFQDTIHLGKSKFQSFDEYVWGFVKSLVPNSDYASSERLGTFHVHYYLDDELVMVTIVDITPSCFISIYFFYDPAIRFIHPGIFTVIREIALTRKLQKSMPSLKYYILGYYNYTLPKVSYKSQFRPTEIQCPDTYRWLPINDVMSRISSNKYMRLSDDEYDSKLDKAVDELMVSFFSMPPQPYQGGQVKRDLLKKIVQEFGPYGISDEIIINLTAEVNI